MTDRQSLLNALQSYHTDFPEEKEFIPRFQKLLEHPRAFHRDHLPGHMTGSAWIIDNSGKFILLTHHAKLNKWLQPGGHADGDENIVNVGLREAEEETGLKNLKLIRPAFDIDIHMIPERKDFPQHDHYDVRSLFQADKNETLIVTEESHDLAWVPIEEVPGRVAYSNSIIRMLEKTKQLL